MSTIIEDGVGSGNKVKVKNNRIFTSTETSTFTDVASIEGNAYNINTGVINLTNATKKALLYIINNSETNLIIDNIFYILGDSDGTDEHLVTVLKNPTMGTIIDNAIDCEMAGVNRNFGSAKALDGSFYKGSNTDTFTNGTKIIETLLTNNATRVALSAGVITLPRDSSLGIEIVPATGNTSMNLEIALAVHRQSDTLL